MTTIQPILNGSQVPYDTSLSIIDLFTEQVNKTPNHTALVHDPRSLTYQELYNAACHVAHHFKQLGVKPGDNITLVINPCLEFITTLLGILMCGANYTSIDRNYPIQRIKHIVNHTICQFLVSDQLLLQQVGQSTTSKLINLTMLDTLHTDSPPTIKMPATNGHDIAYIVYTSGSTGKPKGIKVPHRAVNNHMLWMKNQFALTSDDRFLLKTPLAFDPSVWEIFLPLYIGATLVIAEPGTHANPTSLTHYITQHNITVLQLVPVMLHQFLLDNQHNAFHTLRYLFVGGETLELGTKQLFFQSHLSCKLINLYGPAEATIDTTFYQVTNDPDQLAHNYIGQPIDNVSLYILDKQGNPCQPGQAGELCISGDNVASGYLNGVLASKNFASIYVNDHERSLYKTGDLVKLGPHHQLEYVGRQDNQLKINGVRIEPNDIKCAILKNTAIQNVFIGFDASHNNQIKQLVCFLVPNHQTHINIAELKSQLKKQLPAYMIPHRCYVIDHPHQYVSPNGKFDITKALNAVQNQPVAQPMDNTSDKTNHIKQTLMNIWSSILAMPLSDMHLHTSFYDLGGDSIGTFMLLNKINETFSLSLSTDQLIQYQTLNDQLQFIKQQMSDEKSQLEDRTIVSLNEPADIDLYLIHPIGGTILWYLRLARLLNKKIHVYGIQDPGILTGNTLFNSMDEMASYYAKCITSKNDGRPIILGGASFGATVAVETAKKLNCPVERIIILDGWAIYPNQLKNRDYFYQSMLKQQRVWKNKFDHASYSINFDQMFDIQLSRVKLLFDYHMSPIDIHLDIFKADETMPIFEPFDDLYNHWNKFAKHYTLHHAKGNHETMFLDPNISSLANSIEKMSMREASPHTIDVAY